MVEFDKASVTYDARLLLGGLSCCCVVSVFACLCACCLSHCAQIFHLAKLRAVKINSQLAAVYKSVSFICTLPHQLKLKAKAKAKASQELNTQLL